MLVKNIPLFDLKREFSKLKPAILKKWELLLDNTQFTSGVETEKFERDFATFCQVKYAVGISSGTASLIIALLAVGIGRGDEVITTPFTFSATADSIILSGAIPVFADVKKNTGNIDPNQIAKKITKKTKAILVVHMYGVPCDINKIKAIAKENKLIVIEDASHAHGSIYSGRKTGSFGDIACFSLYPSKTLGAAGNAGVIVSNKKRVISKVRALAHHGIVNKKTKYLHSLIGYNELINNMQAAVLNIKMNSIENIIARKLDIARQYNKSFEEHGHLGMQWPSNTRPSLYVYSIQVENRSSFIKHMEKNGISTGVYYPIPLHMQESYVGHRNSVFPIAESFAKHTVSLPLFADLTTQEIQKITCAIHKYFDI